MVAPISCVECRRRKIRCNKESTCHGCLKRNIECIYPNKFRSIDINKIHNKIQSTSTIDKSEEKIKTLEQKLALTEDLISIFDTNGISHLEIDESKFKYFGEHSVNTLQSTVMDDADKVIGVQPNSVAIYREVNHEIKKLPSLSDDSKENMRLVKHFVEEYFKRNEFTYLTDLFDRDEIMGFLDSYNQIIEWKHDEIMTTVIVILIDVLKNCMNYQFEPLVDNQCVKLKELLTYYFQISKVQPVETLNLIKTQIILINYYYFCYDFSKSWKLLFQMVSNCYSIGLHIDQGPIWLKVNFLEAILCSVSSRPSILDISFLRRDYNNNDPVGEIEFIELLRLKNKINVNCYVNKTNVQYTELLKLDAKFDVYTSFLKTNIIKYDKINYRCYYEKTNFLLIMITAFHLNLHYETFQTNCESNQKMIILFNQFLDVVTNYIQPNELNTIRDKLAALECLFYQSLLIFIKYLNYKIVNAILNNDGRDRADFQQLKFIQEKLQKVRDENPAYGNARTIKALEIIQSLKFDELTGTSLIIKDVNTNTITNGNNGTNNSNGPGTSTSDLSELMTPMEDQELLSSHCYTNNDIKDLLETTNVDLIVKNIAALPRYQLDEQMIWREQRF